MPPSTCDTPAGTPSDTVSAALYPVSLPRTCLWRAVEFNFASVFAVLSTGLQQLLMRNSCSPPALQNWNVIAWSTSQFLCFMLFYRPFALSVVHCWIPALHPELAKNKLLKLLEMLSQACLQYSCENHSLGTTTSFPETALRPPFPIASEGKSRLWERDYRNSSTSFSFIGKKITYRVKKKLK